MNNQPKPMRVVVLREDGCNVAQCVDIDVAGHGATPEQALDAFGKMLIRRVLLARQFGKAPLEGIPAPPPEYLRMWEEAARAGRSTPFRIPDFEITSGAPVDRASIPSSGRYALVA